MAQCIVSNSFGGGSGSEDCTGYPSNVLAGRYCICVGSNDDPVVGTLPTTSVLTTSGGSIIPRATGEIIVNPTTAYYEVPSGAYFSKVTGIAGLPTGFAGNKIVPSKATNEIFLPAGTHVTADTTVTKVTDSNLTSANIVGGIRVLVGSNGTNFTDVTGSYTSDATVAATDVLSPKIAYGRSTRYVGTMPNRGALDVTMTTSTVTNPAGYYTGVTCEWDSSILASNIKKGISIYGISGSYTTCPTESAIKAEYVLRNKIGFVNGGTAITGSIDTFTWPTS